MTDKMARQREQFVKASHTYIEAVAIKIYGIVKQEFAPALDKLIEASKDGYL